MEAIFNSEDYPWHSSQVELIKFNSDFFKIAEENAAKERIRRNQNRSVGK